MEEFSHDMESHRRRSGCTPWPSVRMATECGYEFAWRCASTLNYSVRNGDATLPDIDTFLATFDWACFGGSAQSLSS